MPSYTQPPYLLEEVRVEYCDRTAPGPGILACEAPAVYRPRHAEATVSEYSEVDAAQQKRNLRRRRVQERVGAYL